MFFVRVKRIRVREENAWFFVSPFVSAVALCALCGFSALRCE